MEYRRISQGSRWIYVGNNSRVEVKGIGTCKLVLYRGQVLYLHDVLFAPDIRRNLISIPVLFKLGYVLNFYSDCIDIYLDSVRIGTGYLLDSFVVLNTEMNGYYDDNGCFSIIASSDNANVNTWHARLGHIGQDRMNRLAKEGFLGSLNKTDLPVCKNCLVGKTTRKPFGKGIRAENPLQLVHSDICGPMNVRARSGASYFITFIDDYTRYGHVYLISHKSEALDCFRLYLNMVENQLDRIVKVL